MRKIKMFSTFYLFLLLIIFAFGFLAYYFGKRLFWYFCSLFVWKARLVRQFFGIFKIYKKLLAFKILYN